MTPAAHVIATCTALICCAGAPPALSAAPEAPVLAQNLEQVRSSGKLLAALWTRRSNAYTLQLVFPDPTSRIIGTRILRLTDEPTNVAAKPADGTISTPAISSREQIAATRVWVLAANGTVVIPTAKPAVAAAPTPITSLRYLGRQTPFELQYNFPLAATQNAVAIAVMLDDKLYIERLEPLVVESK